MCQNVLVLKGSKSVPFSLPSTLSSFCDRRWYGSTCNPDKLGPHDDILLAHKQFSKQSFLYKRGLVTELWERCLLRLLIHLTFVPSRFPKQIQSYLTSETEKVYTFFPCKALESDSRRSLVLLSTRQTAYLPKSLLAEPGIGLKF